jgi:hypothetical protein
MASPFMLEPLEGRLLLAADLTGAITANTLNDPSVPTNSEAVTVRVTNQGNSPANSPSQVAVYASLDNALDATDVLLGTANAPNKIAGGTFADVNVSLAIPSTLRAGTYTLLTKVDATNVIAESNENNNLVVGPNFNVIWQFGTVPGITGSTTLQLTDSDGTLVTFKLNGPGTGTVVQNGTKWDVRVIGTDATSVLTIDTTAAGDGRVSINDFFMSGPLKTLAAATTDLSGTLAVLGALSDATLGSITGGTVAAPTVTGTLMVKGNVQNATILIGANLGQDGKLGGTGVNADTFGTGSLAKLVINGNMTSSTVRIGVDPVDGIFGNGNDVIVGGTSSSLGTLSIVGTMSADSKFFAGKLPTTASINGATMTLAGNPSFSTDVQGPTLAAGLTQDTGTLATDHVTMNPSITGTVSDPNGIATFTAGFGATPSFNIMTDVVNGTFTLSQARLTQINGGTLADGSYTLTLKATDIYGNPRQTTVAFTLDTTVAQPVFDLAAASDTQVVGDQKTTATPVTLVGQTEPNALVELLGVGLSTTADPTGLFTFANVALVLGANVLTARATDTAGNQKTFSRTITRVAAPVLDPIGNQLVNEGQLLTFTAHATDADTPASGLTYSLTGSVPTGATINAQTGVFTWTPTEAQGPGTYSFAVVVTDNGTPALSDSKLVSVAVNEVNQAPVLNAIVPQTVNEGQQLTFTATASDPDVPANQLSFSLQNAPAGAAINPTTGVFTWTPTEAQGPGIYTFTAIVTDNGTPALSDSKPVSVTVNEVNEAPVLQAIAPQTVNEGQQLTFTATATDADLPANTLTFSLQNAPAGAVINPTSGVFTWTPTEAQGPGVYTFTTTVTDNGTPALSDTKPVSVTVNEVNQAPVLQAIAPQTVVEGQQLTFTAQATDADVPANQLTYSLQNAPAGAVINPTTGVFTWTPTEAQGPGIYTFTAIVTDNGTPALSDTKPVSITVNEVNQAPVLAPIPNQTVNEGSLLTFKASATDSDIPAQTLTYSLTGTVPQGASINAQTGVFSWTPTEAQGGSSYTFQVVANDGLLNSAPQSVQVTVNKVNTAPVLAPIPNQTVNEGQLLTFTAQATDSDRR